MAKGIFGYKQHHIDDIAYTLLEQINMNGDVDFIHQDPMSDLTISRLNALYRQLMAVYEAVELADDLLSEQITELRFHEKWDDMLNGHTGNKTKA